MKNKFITLIITSFLIITMKAQDNPYNPFFEKYKTPYEVPPFNLIKNEHYKPAFLKGIDIQKSEIDNITHNQEKPSFQNTIIAFENSGELLSKVSSVFYNLNSANTNDEMQAIAKDLAPIISAHYDDIYMNKPLFDRVKYVWDNKNNESLTAEDLKLLENSYKSFIRSGANLNDADKEKLKKINSELSVLTLNFGQNILAENNHYNLIVDDKTKIKNLPSDLIDNAQKLAESKGLKDKWAFNLSYSVVMPFLQYCTDRALRKELWNAYVNRGNNGDKYDNNENALKMINLRIEQANLLGYKTHSDYILEESMAKTPEKVNTFLKDLWTPTLKKLTEEEQEIKKMMNDDGITGEVMPYDWRFYSEKIRKAKFNLDEQEFKPYFSLDNTTQGVFKVCDNLYGLQFQQNKNIPTYHPDVTTWEVKEKDGTLIGILYMDFYPRPSKKGGAWMTSYRSQKTENGKRKIPVISIVCNFSTPTEEAPALFSLDEVRTYFHEFGHALHGLLSNVTYESLAGTNVPRDFVELPSQVMENWATDSEVLKMYAKHYKTDEIIPDELINKFIKAGTFGQGFETGEYLASSLLDMYYHNRNTPIEKQNLIDYENKFLKEQGLTAAVVARHRSTYFNHIFAGGYSSGYYSYIWSGVLDTDAFAQFKNTELFSQEKAQKFRKHILEKGGTEEPMNLYIKFRGAEPSNEYLLKKRGLNIN